jgi:hypothetical protein
MQKHHTNGKDFLKRILISGLIVGFVLLLIPIGTYGFHFHWRNLSHNSSDWGAFSDFVSGILNPIFSIINILILIYLTIKVANWDSNREQEYLKRELHLRNYELMYSALKDFGAIFSKLGERINLSIKNKNPLEFGLVRFEFEALVDINRRHFKYFSSPENSKKVLEDIINVMNLLASLYKRNIEQIDNEIDDEIYNVLMKLYEDYSLLLIGRQCPDLGVELFYIIFTKTIENAYKR